MSNIPQQVLKPSDPEIHRRFGHKNILPFRNLIEIATDSFLSMRVLSEFDDPTVVSIIFNSEATNITAVTGNSILGPTIAQENEESPVNHPEEG